jgi:hypothetical protein
MQKLDFSEEYLPKFRSENGKIQIGIQYDQS